MECDGRKPCSRGEVLTELPACRTRPKSTHADPCVPVGMPVGTALEEKPCGRPDTAPKVIDVCGTLTAVGGRTSPLDRRPRQQTGGNAGDSTASGRRQPSVGCEATAGSRRAVWAADQPTEIAIRRPTTTPVRWLARSKASAARGHEASGSPGLAVDTVRRLVDVQMSPERMLGRCRPTGVPVGCLHT